MDKISVIVPVYNVSQYLKKCVDSIIHQTYATIEIILVDDGSTDGSGLICDQLQKEDNRIKVIHKANGGLSDARNKGIEAASGDYLAFIDSDDFILPEMFEYLLKYLKEYQCRISMCNYIEFYDGDQTEQNGIILNENEITAHKLTKEDSYNPYYNSERFIEINLAWNKLYEKSLFQQIRYPKGKIHEDMATTYLLLYEAKDVVYIECPLYCYRKRKDSIMGVGITKKSLDGLDALADKLHFYNLHDENQLYLLSFFYYKSLLLDYMNAFKKDELGNFKVFKPYVKIFKNNLKNHKKLMGYSKKKYIRDCLFARFPQLYAYLHGYKGN